jgi:hypothetical protein
LKAWHEDGGICLGFGGRGARTEVDEGSKPAAAGVNSAFRFWVMESSIEALDMRRKSAAGP